MIQKQEERDEFIQSTTRFLEIINSSDSLPLKFICACFFMAIFVPGKGSWRLVSWREKREEERLRNWAESTRTRRELSSQNYFLLQNK